MISKQSAQKVEGVWTALATPFKEDFTIDWSAFDKLLEHQVQGGIDGLVLSGTTGESATLTVPEKLSLIRRARTRLPAHMKVMAGCGDSNTLQCMELAKLSEDAGASSLLIVTPPYNKPSTAGLILHYQAVAKASKLPICLYHVPSRTAQFLTLDAIKTLCREAPIAAIKEASGDLGYFSRVARDVSQTVLSGDDITFLPSLAVGGHGVISVITNIFPEAFVAIYKAYLSGEVHKAQKIHKTLLPAIDVLFCEVNPCPLKAALKILNLGESYLRLPLAPVSQDNFEKIRLTLETVRSSLQSEIKNSA